MNNIQTRPSFFPNSKSAQGIQTERTNGPQELKRNSPERSDQIREKTAKDATVDIPSAVKDFARIKKAVDAAPQIDNTDKIAKLRQQIQSGTYEIDYDAVADKMLTTEF